MEPSGLVQNCTGTGSCVLTFRDKVSVTSSRLQHSKNVFLTVFCREQRFVTFCVPLHCYNSKTTRPLEIVLCPLKPSALRDGDSSDGIVTGYGLDGLGIKW